MPPKSWAKLISGAAWSSRRMAAQRWSAARTTITAWAPRGSSRARARPGLRRRSSPEPTRSATPGSDAAWGSPRTATPRSSAVMWTTATSARHGSSRVRERAGRSRVPSSRGQASPVRGSSGWAVALSGDGDTALVSARKDNDGLGALWIFTRSGSTWTQDGEKLTAAGGSGGGGGGSSVALSADGGNGARGGPPRAMAKPAPHGHSRTAAPVGRSRAKRLTPAEGSGRIYFGDDVALSSEGSSALVGGPGTAVAGAAWLFKQAGSNWAQQGSRLVGGEEVGKAQFGWSVRSPPTPARHSSGG